MLGLIFIIIVVVVIALYGGKPKTCDFCGSTNLTESEDFGRSHEETWYYCTKCGRYQD